MMLASRCWACAATLLALLQANCATGHDSAQRSIQVNKSSVQVSHLQRGTSPGRLLESFEARKVGSSHIQEVTSQKSAPGTQRETQQRVTSSPTPENASAAVSLSARVDSRVPTVVQFLRLLSPLSYYSNKAMKGADSAVRAITFVCVEDPMFATNLGFSSLWRERQSLPHEWLLLRNREQHSISYLYSHAHAFATHDLVVFLHSDVLLPDPWYDIFMEKLGNIEALDPNWGALGAAGVPVGWPENPAMNATEKIATSIIDQNGPYYTGADNMPVQAFDEQLLVLRRLGGPKFDLDVPGLDLYGTDIALTARSLGMQSYLVNVVSMHKISDVDGRPFQLANFMAKIEDPAYKARADQTIQYLERKWCGSGFLPVHACADFDLQQQPSCV